MAGRLSWQRPDNPIFRLRLHDDRIKDEVVDEYRHEYEDVGAPEIQLSVFTLDAFRQHATWGSAQTWARYNFAHLRTLVDKTGEAQKLIENKGTISSAEIPKVINQALDHYINQVYRSIKCARDGQCVRMRLEAAEGINPLLDAVFALNGRLRPYFKYIEWEFENYPLFKLGMAPKGFPRRFIGNLDLWQYQDPTRPA